MENDLAISEIFYSLQGEGTHSGLPTAFIRLQGCNLKCSWCDSAFAQNIFDLEQFEDLSNGGSFPCKIRISDLLDRIKNYKTNLVCITGGEPLLQNSVYTLITELCNAKYTVLIETNGSFPINKIDERAIKIVDFKCPSSNMASYNNYKNIDYLTKKDEIKFVIENRADYLWAKDLISTYNLGKKVFAILFSPVFSKIDLKELAAWILQDALPVRLQIQMHKIIWGENERGV